MTNKSIQPIASSLPISFPHVYGENVERMYPEIRISIERITPEVAEKMLKANINNRKLHRESIAQAINNGEWELNGATIVFDENGNLIDGQHRLTACIKTKTPIDTVVVRGIHRTSQITMDTGVKRKLNDYLVIDGYKNATTVGAIGLGLIYSDTFGLESSFGRQSGNLLTVKTCHEFVRNHYDERIEPLVHPVMLVRERFSGNVTQGKTLGILFDVFRKAGEDNFNEFVGQLCGTRVACVSVMLLRNKLLDLMNNTKGTDIRPTQRHIAALIIKTWNAYMNGDDIKQLKFTQGGAHPEKFPSIFLGYE